MEISQETNYNASNIKILKQTISDPRFDWKLSIDLSIEYNKDVKWIERSIRACREAGKSPDYFINRYLKKLDIDLDNEINAASINVIRDDG